MTPERWERVQELYHASRARPDVATFCDWVEAQAALTRAATGEEATAPTPPPPAR